MQNNLLRFDTTSTFTFFDFETFNLNLNFCHNLPWELAMGKVKNGQLIEHVRYLIKWDTKLKISDDTAKITGYSQSSMNKDGVPPEKVFPVFSDWINSADYICGHNILNFDIYLLFEWYKLNNCNPSKLVTKCIDTNAIYKGYKLQIPFINKNNSPSELTFYQQKMLGIRQRGLKSSLQHVGKELGVEHNYETLHQALSDIQLNIKIWDKLKYLVEI